ncbi:MAG: tetratricopeptide repeat protein [Bacteroidales bacterium]|nr:tetratricopeptide repeat protein [Bacteroidales bacterium]MCF8457419.1 tetratricopeptide repeat protein [Bacteroidales bacterium]
MKYKKHFYSIFFIVLLHIVFVVQVQSQFDIDSMKLALSQAENKDKANILLKLSNEYMIVSQDLSLKYAHDALDYTRKFPNDSMLALVYKTIGVYHHYYNQNDSAIYYNLLALKIYKQLDDIPALGKIYNNLGIFYSDIGLYTKSIEFHLQSLEIKEKLADSVGLSHTYNNIGTLYYDFKNYDQALDYFKKAQLLAQKLQDEMGIQSALTNLGLIYSEQGDYNKALGSFNQALEINNRLNQIYSISDNLQNIGMVYYNMKDYEKALDFLLRTQDLNNSYSIKSPSNQNSLGQVYNALENYQQALYYFKTGYDLALETKDINYLLLTSSNLALVYKQLKDYDKAWMFLNESHQLKDSLNKEIYSKQIGEFGVRMAIENKGEGKAKIAKELTHAEQASDDFGFISFKWLAFIFGIAFIAMLIIYLSTRRKKAKPVIREKSTDSSTLLREIVNSSSEFIHYVDGEGRIQESNRAYRKLFEFGDNDLRGLNMDELIKLSPFYADAIRACFNSNAEVWNFKRPVREVIKIKTPNGPEKIIEVEKIPIFNNDKARKGIISIGKDITNAQFDPEKTTGSNKQFTQLMDKLPVMAMAFDESGNISFWNNSCVESTRWKAEDVISKPEILADIFDPVEKLEVSNYPENSGPWQIINIHLNEGEKKAFRFQKLNEAPFINNCAYWLVAVPLLDSDKEALDGTDTNQAQSIIEQFFDAVFYVDKDGVFLDYVINSPYVLPEKTDELRLKKISDKIFPKNIASELISAIGEVMESGIEKYLSYRHKDEKLPGLEAFLRPYTTDKAVILVRKKNNESEAGLTAAVDEYENVFLSSPNPLFLIDSKGKVLKANNAGISLLGIVSHKEMVTQDFTSFIDSSIEGLEFKDFSALADNQTTSKIHLKNSKNQPFIGEIKICKINYLDHTDALFVSVRDIAPQLKLEEDLKEANKKLQGSDKFNPHFLANMSHDIRTSMNSITGFSNLLTHPNISEDQRLVYINNISQSSKSLLKIIDDIIDVSKIEAGQITLNEEICYLKHLFAEFYNDFSESYKEKVQSSIEFKVHLESRDSDFAIYTDAFRLKQVMSKIISNAFEFTTKGSIEIGYSVPDNQTIKFYVKDTGRGISKEKQDLLFDRFNMVDETATRVFGGAGLGLTISKSLINLMDGQIYVESEKGKGSNFYFTLPYKPVFSQDAPESEYDMPPGKVYNFEGKKILIAEDVEPNYQLVKSLLRKTKADLIWAKDGKEAVELCKKQKMDIIVMDIQMPVLNGFEAMKIIKKKNKDIPIIAQTAYAMIDDGPKIIAEGFDEYISKPLKAGLFLAMLDKLLK